MANLNFKWGLHENLVKMTTSEVGAVYFTKDEGGLYLGVDANKAPKRVQGVVQYYADLTQFKSNVLPPYSSDIIYYIASENALVKWNGEKIAADGTKQAGQFTVLNVTASEFTDTIQTLNSTIAGHNNRISQNTTNITGLRTDLGANDKAETTAFARIQALEEAVDELEALTGTGGTGNSLTDRIKALEDWRSDAEDDIEALQKDVSGHTTTIGQHTATLNDHENRISTLETWKGNASSSISDHGNRIAQAEQDIKDINDDISKIVNTDLVTINTDISGLKTTTSGLRADLGNSNDKSGTTAFGRIAALEAEDVKINAAADALEKRVKNAEDAVSNHGTRLTTAEGEIDQLQTDVAKNKGDIGNLNSNLTNNYYTKSEVNNLHTSLENELREELTDHINAANALVYIGGISSIGEWDNVKNAASSVGNTYIVAASGLNLQINGSTVTCYAGDLLIATGDENDNNVIPAGDVEWVHVKAGYNESLASTLRVIDGDTTSVHKKATVQLSSYKGAAAQNHGDLGQFSIVSDSENLEVKVNQENVAISMVWGDF